jgi:hypothetical protein
VALDAIAHHLKNAGIDTREHKASQVASHSHQGNQPGTGDLREISNGLSSSQEETLTPSRTQKRRMRSLADIIWENQLFYNDFIKNKVPRLLH